MEVKVLGTIPEECKDFVLQHSDHSGYDRVLEVVKLLGCSVIDYHNAKLAKKGWIDNEKRFEKTFGVTKNKNYYLLFRPQKAKFPTFFLALFLPFF